MCRIEQAIMLSFLIIACFAGPAFAQLADFSVVAFPKAGEEVRVSLFYRCPSSTCQSGEATSVKAAQNNPRFPIFTASVNTSTLLSYEYTIHKPGFFGSRFGKSIVQESSAFPDGKRRTFIPTAGARPNEFFGDANVYTNLAATQLPTVHSYEPVQAVTPHTIYNESMIGMVHLQADPKQWAAFVKASTKPKGTFTDTQKKPEINAVYTFVNAEAKYSANVTVTVAGFGSLIMEKKSFLVHFSKEDEKAWGLKQHKVKAMTYDPSLVHEYTSVDIRRAMGVPVHRIAWTRLYINGKFMGIYNNLETISNRYLHERFPATKKLDDGVMYKCNDKAYLTKDSVKLCDLDQGTPSDWADLTALVGTLTNTSDAAFPAAIDAVMDVPDLIRVSAVEIVTLRRDGYFDDGSNYVMWMNPATKKWQYISWDFEIDLMAPLDVDAFDKPWSFFKKPFINTTIFPRYLPQVPLTRVLQVPAWRQQYIAYAKELVALMTSPAMDARLKALHDTLRPYVAQDPLYGADMAYTVKDFDKATDSIVMKSKVDIAARRYLGLKLGIPDLLHSDFLDVEILGLRPFMKQRAQSVEAQLARIPDTLFGQASQPAVLSVQQ